MKKYKTFEQHTVAAAARPNFGAFVNMVILTGLIMVFMVLFIMSLTDWSLIMPYYHLESAADVQAFEKGRGKQALMDADGLQTFDEEVTVTSNFTSHIMFGGNMGPIGSSSSETDYQLYYQYYPNTKGDAALAVLACPADTSIDTARVNVNKFSDDLTQSFYRSWGEEDMDGITLHFFRMTPHHYPVWVKYAVYFSVIVLLLFIYLCAPCFSFIQRRSAIGKRIAAYGEFESVKQLILDDYHRPLYRTGKEFIGRKYLMYYDKTGPKNSARWMLYAMSDISSMEVIADPGGVENCFQLTLCFEDGIHHTCYLYMTEPEARQLADSISMYAGLS